MRSVTKSPSERLPLTSIDPPSTRTPGVLASRSSAVNAPKKVVRWGYRDDNPAEGVERNIEAPRRRYLQPDELQRLTTVLAAYPERQAANIFRLLLLTGARKSEVLAMRWADVDLGTDMWTKPGSSTKQKTDHEVPLSAPVRRLLSEIRAEQMAAVTDFWPMGVSDPCHYRARCKNTNVPQLLSGFNADGIRGRQRIDDANALACVSAALRSTCATPAI